MQTTLTSEPVAPLLDRLFREADILHPAEATSTAKYWNSLSQEDRQRIVRSKTEYRDFYSQMKDIPLAVSRETGNLLYVLARHSNAKNIVEFGTSFGLSTLHLAAAVRDNGGGSVITTEFEPHKVACARENLAEGGVLDIVEVREGDALESLRRNLPESVDLLLLDGAKALYPEILALVEPKLRPGAVVVADNADLFPDYLKQMRAKDSGYLSVPFGEDVELSVKL